MPVLASDEQIENALRFRKVWSTYQENKNSSSRRISKGFGPPYGYCSQNDNADNRFPNSKMSEASSAEQSMTALRELIHEF